MPMIEPFSGGYRFPSNGVQGSTVTALGWSAILATEAGFIHNIFYDRLNSRYVFSNPGLADAKYGGLNYPLDGGGAGAGGSYTKAYVGPMLTVKIRLLQNSATGGTAIRLINSVADAILKKSAVTAFSYTGATPKFYLHVYDAAGASTQAGPTDALALNTDYWLEIGADGTNWTLKIFSDAAKTTQIGATLTVNRACEVLLMAPESHIWGGGAAGSSFGSSAMSDVDCPIAVQTPYPIPGKATGVSAAATTKALDITFTTPANPAEGTTDRARFAVSTVSAADAASKANAGTFADGVKGLAPSTAYTVRIDRSATETPMVGGTLYYVVVVPGNSDDQYNVSAVAGDAVSGTASAAGGGAPVVGSSIVRGAR